MIASIDSQADIFIYFNKLEIEKLSQKQIIDGCLIRSSRSSEPQVGSIETQVDETRSNINYCYGIGVDDKEYWGVNNFKIRVYIGNDYFNDLQNNGRAGTRHSMLDGSKISLRTIEKLDGIDRFWVDEMIEISTREKHSNLQESN
jgi:hypothetical protein